MHIQVGRRTVAIVTFLVFQLHPASVFADWRVNQVFASDAESGDQFGGCSSVTNSFAGFGAKFEDEAGTDSGALYIYKLLLNQIQQTQKLLASDGQANDRFGSACSMSGSWLSVGAPLADTSGNNDRGAVYMFQLSGSTWSQTQKILAPDGAASDLFGTAVAVASPYLFIGAPGDDDLGTNAGAVYVYKFVSGSWAFQEKLFASDGAAQKQFARSVSLSGTAAVVGMLENNPEGAAPGKAYVFRFQSSQNHWEQEQMLSASDGALDDRFGMSVGISGNTIVVGAPGKNQNGINSGAAYIFSRSNSNWNQSATLSSSTEHEGDSVGQSVAIASNAVFVGAPFDDQGGSNKGATYYFLKGQMSWSLVSKLIPSNGMNEENFGSSVALISKTGAIGSPKNAAHGSNSGAGYVLRGPLLYYATAIMDEPLPTATPTPHP